MLHRVKNLNSALINLILQQKSFNIINIFSSWIQFHIFLFHTEGSGGQIPVTYSTPETKMWLMSSPDCVVNVLLSPSSTALKSLTLFLIRQITHQVGIFPPSPLTHVVTKCLLLISTFHSKSIFFLQNYKFKLHFQIGFPQQAH